MKMKIRENKTYKCLKMRIMTIKYDREKGEYDREKGEYDREKGEYDREKGEYDREN